MNSEKQSTNLQMTLREVNRVGEVKKNIPKLRFKGYEDAWEQRRLEEIFLKIRNAFVGTSTPYYVEKNQGGHFYIESNNVKHGKINHDTEVFINEEFYQNQKDKWLKTGDIVMVQSGHVGHSAVIPEYLNNSAAHALIMFQEYKIETNPYFINFQFQTESVRNKIDSITTGNTIKHILASDMKLFSISNTQKKEADKLGDFFISLDNLITLHQRKLDELKNMKKTLLSKMFPKNGEVVPEIRFKEFTDAWEQRKLGTAINVKSGKDYKHLDEGDVPVYGTGGYMLSVSEALENTRDAIGIGRKGTIDKPFVLKAPFWTVDTLFYCIPKENNSLSFLYSLFQSINWKLYDESTGVPSLSKTVIDGVTIKLTSEDEQSSIGEYFESVNNLITLHQRKLDELKNMKKTLLQQMFV